MFGAARGENTILKWIALYWCRHQLVLDALCFVLAKAAVAALLLLPLRLQVVFECILFSLSARVGVFIYMGSV